MRPSSGCQRKRVNSNSRGPGLTNFERANGAYCDWQATPAYYSAYVFLILWPEPTPATLGHALQLYTETGALLKEAGHCTRVSGVGAAACIHGGYARGRTLTHSDLNHYERIAVTVKETLRLMDEIDGLIPRWPLVPTKSPELRDAEQMPFDLLAPIAATRPAKERRPGVRQR